MPEEKKMPKGWDTLYKSLGKGPRKYVDEGDFMEAYTHPDNYKDLEVIVHLFLMQHYMEKWDEIAKNDWFVKRFISYCDQEYEYFAETSNAFDYFRRNKKPYKMEYATAVCFVDKFLELHNGQIPKSSFFDNIAEISGGLSDEELENPSLEILDFCNK